MDEAIINKVAESGLITLDLEKFYPLGEVAIFDLKDYLFKGLILKEKDFRDVLKGLDWEIYRNKFVGVTCTTDAIIPPWAYMLVATYLQPVAANVVMGSEKDVHKEIFLENIRGINVNDYADQRVVIKGCGEKNIEEFAYMEITKLLRPIAKTIMYGEPCSTVPVYKRKA